MQEHIETNEFLILATFVFIRQVERTLLSSRKINSPQPHHVSIPLAT